MYGIDPHLTASHVLDTFRSDAPYLFLGAAFTTFGLVTGAFAFLGRKFDAMLLWLAVFAILYGQRMWLQTNLLPLVWPTTFFFRLAAASNYLVPVPGFFYFQAAGFLGRYGRRIAIALSVPFLYLFFATMLIGTIAISGLPPFAGFFSKDEILANAFEQNPIAWGVAVVASLLTSFYMFRLLFLAAPSRSLAVIPAVIPLFPCCYSITAGCHTNI